MYFVPNDLKINPIELSLARPNKQIIAHIKHVFNVKHIVKFGQINELTFQIPYDVDIHSQLTINPVISLIRERYLIRVKQNETVEWYVIAKITKSTNDEEDVLSVECFSLPYELRYKRIYNYNVTSYNCLQVVSDCLEGTGWKIGYINPEFNLMYRSFDVSSQNKMDFLFDICETFNAIPQFDTIQEFVHLYKEEELVVNKGLKITKYLQSLEDVIDIDEICTQLHVYGRDDLSINGVNPTGQSYIEDYSYFLFPFQRDEFGNVISHSDWMSDELCHAILDYNELVKHYDDKFQQLLKNKKEQEEEITKKRNELTILENELMMILDSINVAKKAGENIESLNKQKQAKEIQIASVKKQIKDLKSKLDSIQNDINELNILLKKENNFSKELLDELAKFTFVQEWSDENYFNEVDLYNAAWNELQKRNTPPVNIDMNIINFLSILDEKMNWERLHLGTIVSASIPKLNINVKAKITELHFDHENDSIDVVISNQKRVEDEEKKAIRMLYQTNKSVKDVNKRKMRWEQVAENFNKRNDRNSTPLINPSIFSIQHTKNDDGSINLSIQWVYPFATESKTESVDIDGFLIYLYSSKTNELYTFGSTLGDETIISVTSDKRSYIFPSIPANLYYTLGVQAYRVVDTDIDVTGYIKSDIITNSSPYLPEPLVQANMNVNGKLNGVMHTSSPTPPSDPSVGDVWYDTTENRTKIFDGDTWNIAAPTQAEEIGAVSVDVYNSDIVNIVEGINSHVENTIIHLTQEEKQKLSTIQSGAEQNQNAFTTVKVGTTNIVAENKTDILELKAGTGIVLSADEINDKITISMQEPLWAEILLQNGVLSYNTNTTPKYCKIGNIVFIKGAVKNINSPVIIGTLPFGFRPSSAVFFFIQNRITTSSTSTSFASWSIGLDGSIKLEAIGEGTWSINDWYPIDTCFIVG